MVLAMVLKDSGPTRAFARYGRHAHEQFDRHTDGSRKGGCGRKPLCAAAV